MNIVVCVKQVPDTTVVKIDPVKHTLIRDGVPSIMNPDDKGGLELAREVLRLCDQRAAIPIRGEVQSLNVSVAAGVMIYEAVRQRGL